MPLINLIVIYLQIKYGVPLHIFFFEKWTGGTSFKRISGSSFLKMWRGLSVTKMLMVLGAICHANKTFKMFCHFWNLNSVRFVSLSNKLSERCDRMKTYLFHVCLPVDRTKGSRHIAIVHGYKMAQRFQRNVYFEVDISLMFAIYYDIFMSLA